MAIIPFNLDSPDELRIGKPGLSGGRIFPKKDIYGGDVRLPATTYQVPGNPRLFVVLPHRPLNEDEMKELDAALEGLGTGIPAAPNDSEFVNTDQSAEFIGTPPSEWREFDVSAPAEPTAKEPTGYKGDGTVPVTDGTQSYPAPNDGGIESESSDVQAPPEPKSKRFK